MDDQLNSEIMDLQVRLQAQLMEALPPQLGTALQDLLFLMIFGYIQPPNEAATAEAERILEKYKNLGL